MHTAAAHQPSRSVAGAGQHIYLRPSVRPLPRPRLAEPDTW